RVLAGAAIATTAAAFAIGRSAMHEACSDTPESGLEIVLRSALAVHLDGIGGFAAGERPALLALLDDHRRGWSEARHAACVAYDRGELTTALYERRLTCLARAEASLSATADVLVHATAATFPDARVAAGSLVDPALCDRVDQSLVPLPD